MNKQIARLKDLVGGWPQDSLKQFLGGRDERLVGLVESVISLIDNAEAIAEQQKELVQFIDEETEAVSLDEELLEILRLDKADEKEKNTYRSIIYNTDLTPLQRTLQLLWYASK